jgi:hypothetical protein
MSDRYKRDEGTARVELPFDTVVVMEDAGPRTLSPDAFFALPLAVRIQYVVARRASFMAGGSEVDAKVVLGQIRQRRARPH